MNKKEWIEKFPWMEGFVHEWNGQVEIDECPLGWTDYIGLLCEEINEIIVRDHLDFKPMQIKEKFGELRFYTHSDPMNTEIEKIIDNYSVLLSNVCYNCGKPDSAVSKGTWIECKCRECYEAHHDGNYEDHFYTDEAQMAETRMVTKYSKYGNQYETQHIRYDVRPTAIKIRARWKEKHNDQR